VLGGRESVKVAIVQKASLFLDKEASLERAEAYIAEAAAGGAELIVFPEVWLVGYPSWTEGWDSALQAWVGGRVAFRNAAVLVPSVDTERLGAAMRRARMSPRDLIYLLMLGVVAILINYAHDFHLDVSV
jgi:predicted amidohydrolase